MTRRGKFSGSKQISRYLAYKGEVGWRFKEAYPGHEPTTEPVFITILIQIPKEENYWEWDHHYRAWDLDNVTKTVLDGLNGIAWEDDKQVYSLAAQIAPSKTGDYNVIVSLGIGVPE